MNLPPGLMAYVDQFAAGFREEYGTAPMDVTPEMIIGAITDVIAGMAEGARQMALEEPDGVMTYPEIARFLAAHVQVWRELRRQLEEQ